MVKLTIAKGGVKAHADLRTYYGVIDVSDGAALYRRFVRIFFVCYDLGHGAKPVMLRPAERARICV